MPDLYIHFAKRTDTLAATPAEEGSGDESPGQIHTSQEWFGRQDFRQE